MRGGVGLDEARTSCYTILHLTPLTSHQVFQEVTKQSDALALLAFLGCFEDTYRKWLALNYSLLDCVRKLFRKFGKTL